jgi:hypothetical protein
VLGHAAVQAHDHRQHHGERDLRRRPGADADRNRGGDGDPDDHSAGTDPTPASKTITIKK